ncbi:MAG: dihydroorotate dehydrogenase electron transfer subunit [Chloroflexota bacterium]|nr:dihydroorotate dehydrogenase electron transfer subunit [Chloroflexota bacterium]
MKQIPASIISNEKIAPNMHLVWVDAPGIAFSGQPGQFITIYCENLPLRRPFSIHQVSSNQVAILFKVVGKGTSWLSQRRGGDEIDILGPLGKGFDIMPSVKNLLLVAGGIGIAPLVFLMQRASSQYSITLIYGASTAVELYPFSSLRTEAPSNTSISLPEGMRFISVTEDGTAGEKGMVTNIIPRFVDWADQIFACGPIEMYQAMMKMPLQTNEDRTKISKSQISLEVRMGCGIGTCYGCTINTTEGLRQVCRDGPVFQLANILWQEVRI